MILGLKLIDSSNLNTIERKLVLSGVDYTNKDQLFANAKTALRKFIGEQGSVDVTGGESWKRSLQKMRKMRKH